MEWILRIMSNMLREGRVAPPELEYRAAALVGSEAVRSRLALLSRS